MKRLHISNRWFENMEGDMVPIVGDLAKPRPHPSVGY